jgi:general secretion pathway protein G
MRIIKFLTERCKQVFRNNEGFTLIELMIVIAILAILGAFAVNTFKGVIPNAKLTAVKSNFNTFENALEAYSLNHNSYPTSEEGLQRLVSDGLIKNKKDALLDPWKNPYQYRYPGKFTDSFEIWSFGADGVEGGEGANADIKSWE